MFFLTLSTIRPSGSFFKVTTHTFSRNYASDLMAGNRIYAPSFFGTFKAMFSAYLNLTKIGPKNFTWYKFMEGAQQAVICVSDKLTNGDFDELHGLVSPDSLTEVKENCSKLSVCEREKLRINKESIIIKWVPQVDFKDTSKSHTVKIMTVWHYYPGVIQPSENISNFKEARSEVKRMKENIYVANYNFVTDFVNGQPEGWSVEYLNHFPFNDVKEEKLRTSN